MALSSTPKWSLNPSVFQRIDGRKLDEFRKVRINFGTEWGSTHVALGETRCMVTVSCEVVAPKNSRPNEGHMFINVEFGPMAAVHYEAGKQSEIGVLTSRILERAFNDSRCVDLESLCIVSEEKVWQLRIDVAVLNDAGNVCDCAALGVLAALHHFRRPDVTSTGDSITIYSELERDAIPLVLHHFPVCVSFAIFDTVDYSIADPTALEERVAQSSVVFGVNSYQELCGLHMGGSFLTSPEMILRTASVAAKQAKLFVDLIRATVEADKVAREGGKRVSFMECIKDNAIKTSEQDRVFVKLRKLRKVDQKAAPADVEMEDKLVKINSQSAVLIPANSDQWIPDSEDDEASTEPEQVMKEPQSTGPTAKKKSKPARNCTDSEETQTMVGE